MNTYSYTSVHICLSYPYTQQGVGESRGIALHSMTIRRWRQHTHPHIIWHPSSPLTRCKEWRELHERFTSDLRWSPSEAEMRPVVGGEREGGNSRENPWVSEVWFCIQRRDLVFHCSAVSGLMDAFTHCHALHRADSISIEFDGWWKETHTSTCTLTSANFKFQFN